MREGVLCFDPILTNIVEHIRKLVCRFFAIAIKRRRTPRLCIYTAPRAAYFVATAVAQGRAQRLRVERIGSGVKRRTLD